MIAMWGDDSYHDNYGDDSMDRILEIGEWKMVNEYCSDNHYEEEAIARHYRHKHWLEKQETHEEYLRRIDDIQYS